MYFFKFYETNLDFISTFRGEIIFRNFSWKCWICIHIFNTFYGILKKKPRSQHFPRKFMYTNSAWFSRLANSSVTFCLSHINKFSKYAHFRFISPNFSFKRNLNIYENSYLFQTADTVFDNVPNPTYCQNKRTEFLQINQMK